MNNYLDARTPEEREQNSKITGKVTVTDTTDYFFKLWKVEDDVIHDTTDSGGDWGKRFGEVWHTHHNTHSDKKAAIRSFIRELRQEDMRRVLQIIEEEDPRGKDANPHYWGKTLRNRIRTLFDNK